jgi:exonuclease III
VHKRIDIKNWSGNQKSSGCLPHERAWLDHIYDELGYVDTFREVRKEAELYSWWSNRGQARAKMSVGVLITKPAHLTGKPVQSMLGSIKNNGLATMHL